MVDATETRAVDAGLIERLAGPSLPFTSGEGVACQTLDAPERSPAVPFLVGAVPFRCGGALRLTAFVKATFSLTAPILVPAPAPSPFLRADLHNKNQPLAHVTAANDRVPWKTAADVTLVGHAHAPGGVAIAEMRARFALRSGERALFDKTVRVLGHCIAAGARPKPFTTMPIAYERAFGGPGTPANPIGRGESGVPPNIVHPESPWYPAGFGPIAAAWPLRHKRLGDTPRSNLDLPIMELPATIDWGYFQAAPPDQILPELPPHAVIVLEGLLPDAPRFEAALPGARAVGAVYGCDDADPDAPTELAFHADTLHIDTDQRLVVMVFRACVELRDEAQLGRLLVAAGVGIGGHVPAIPRRRMGGALSQPAQWSAPVALAPRAAPSPLRTPQAGIGSGTIAEGDPRSWLPTMPFGRDEEGPLVALRAPPPPPTVESRAPQVVAPAPPEAPPKAPPVPEKEPLAVKPAAPAEEPKASPWAPAAPAPPDAHLPRPAPARKAPPRIDVLQKVYGRGAKR